MIRNDGEWHGRASLFRVEGHHILWSRERRVKGREGKKKKKRAIEREELALTIVPTFNESITQKVNYTQSLSLLKGRHLIQ